MIKTISAMKARQTLGQILNEVSISSDTYIIERAGKPLVAVIPVREYERIRQDREKARNEFFQWVDEIHEYNKDVDPEILESEIKEAVEAVKKEELAEMKRKADESKELHMETC
ncbi:MAG: type II toxin-antitoxin system Phd/YefM family antitoxin [Nitrospirae bacterium]|nr:type II toxin-antitoxin system Phd/YefM family antitoxin [Nitrospirota bacterium]